MDPHTWRKFAENESDPKKKEQKAKNRDRRKKIKFSHCLGGRSYAQKQYLMEQENPGKVIRRVRIWLAGHEHGDGTVLESAKSKYDEVNAAVTKRKGDSLSGEGCSKTYEDLDDDELAEVFGKDKKGGVRAMGSHISKKQLIQLGVARSKLEQKNKGLEEAATLKAEIVSLVDSKLDGFKGILNSFFSKIVNASNPLAVTTPLSDLGSNSEHHPIHPPQNLNNDLGMNDISNSPRSTPAPTERPPVILHDISGKVLAKGYVMTDFTSKVCHSKNVEVGEKKVYIEQVIEPDAPLWDPPQDEFFTLAGFVQGGFVIWTERWLTYV